MNPRAWAAAAIWVMIAAASLSGCSAGQQAQTATMESAVNGSMATLNNIALRNVRIRAQQTRYALQPGKTVDLALVATNQSPDTADALVAVTADVGAVTLVGNTAIPVEGSLIVDSPDRVVHAGALAAVKPANTATAAVILSKPISNGLSYEFTFQFAHAGEITVGVPVSAD
jgi:copper(I)-binding protein